MRKIKVGGELPRWVQFLRGVGHWIAYRFVQWQMCGYIHDDAYELRSTSFFGIPWYWQQEDNNPLRVAERRRHHEAALRVNAREPVS